MKKRMLINMMGVALFLISGCVDREHRMAELSSELGYTEGLEQQYWVEHEWWKLFENSELDSLINTALCNNPDYIKAAINVNKELYNLSLATSDLFPTLSADAGASSQRSIDRKDKFSSNFSGEAGLKYEVDLYGKIRDLRTAQEFEYKATVMDRETARLSLIYSVIDLYFNLEYLQNSIDVTKANIKAYTDIEDIMKQKYLSGRTDQLEYLESKQSLLNEKNSLLELETTFKEMEASLKNILNMKPNEKLDLRFADILKIKTPGADTDVPLSVLANRPDLQASQYRLEEAFKKLESENKNWYPNISVNGALASTSDKARTTFDFPYILGSVSVDLPFLDWNRVRNNIKISKADYEIALIDFKDTLNQALNEVSYYYFAYKQSEEAYGNISENYNNSTKITKYYDSRYNNGKTEFKNFLEAIHSENTLKKSLIAQKYQIIKYENYLYKAMTGRYGKVVAQ